MKSKFEAFFKNKLLIIDFFSVIIALFYYLFFINKGLVLGDEGYYVHLSQRIADGQIPYKNFVLQYTPGYFFLLALMYKIFGVQIIIGRFISLFFCIFILISILFLLYIYKIKSIKTHILASLIIISLGYPLLHIPIIAWSIVFFAVLLEITYIFWYRSKKFIYIILLGLLLALTFFFKQTIGVVFILIINALLFFSSNKDLIYKLKLLSLLNIVWISLTFIGFYYLFINTNNLSGIIDIYEINKNFISTFPFSYPPLTYIFAPTGIFKLLPYYFPIFFACYVLVKLISGKFNWEKISFSIIALSGFFVTIYPASDLLHVYPFLGLVLVSAIILVSERGNNYLFFSIIIVFIFIGFYLTFFTKSFRYEAFFLKETTPLSLPKTKHILIDKNDPFAYNLVPLYNFINKNTIENDYVFVYPFSPLLYTLLDRQNPTALVQFTLLRAPDSVYSEKRVIEDIMNRQVKFIITAGEYKFNTKLSRFIQHQKQVFQSGPYGIFTTRD